MKFHYESQPDVIAPGVSIIAAYTEATGPTNLILDKRRVSYNVQSGTSMSCPHASGIVGLLKTLHPDWSPAAIKSAIMTTGYKNTLSLVSSIINFLPTEVKRETHSISIYVFYMQLQH